MSFFEDIVRQLEDVFFGREEKTDLYKYMSPQEFSPPVSTKLAPKPTQWMGDEEGDATRDPGGWYRELIEGMSPRIPIEAVRGNTYPNTQQEITNTVEGRTRLGKELFGPDFRERGF